MSDTSHEDKPEIQSPVALAVAALGLGLAFERLLYARPLGLSYPIWILLCITVLFALASREGVRTARGSRFLVIPLLAVAGLVFLRSEPLTVFLGTTVSLLLVGILVRSLPAGGVLRWGWLDFAASLIWVPLEACLRPWGPLRRVQRRVTRGQDSKETMLASLRGVLLAVPVLVVFTVLLSSADIVFGQRVAQVLDWLDLERFFDILGRATAVGLVAIFCLGILVSAYRRRSEAGPILEEDFLPKIGLTEPIVILAGVDLLFALFVSVQFRYFFGGRSAIGIEGFTYAEYARQGFGELVAVSFLTLGLVTLLAAWVRSRRGRAWRSFQGLATVLVGLTGVILVSALERLVLYEQAYGFTRLRTYAHIAIGWMALGFVVFLILFWMGRWQRVAPVFVGGVVLFTLSLGAVNVDGFIVRQNLNDRHRTGEVDVEYLLSLSNDAVPQLAVHLGQFQGEARRRVATDLLCRREALQTRLERDGWPAMRWSDLRARSALDRLDPVLKRYEVKREGESLTVIPPAGEAMACWLSRY